MLKHSLFLHLFSSTQMTLVLTAYSTQTVCKWKQILVLTAGVAGRNEKIKNTAMCNQTNKLKMWTPLKISHKFDSEVGNFLLTKILRSGLEEESEIEFWVYFVMEERYDLKSEREHHLVKASKQSRKVRVPVLSRSQVMPKNAVFYKCLGALTWPQWTPHNLPFPNQCYDWTIPWGSYYGCMTPFSNNLKTENINVYNS